MIAAVVHPASPSAVPRLFAAAASAFSAFAAMVAAAAEPPPELAAPASGVLDAVFDRYAAVSSVSCTVRREVSGTAPDGAAQRAEMTTRIVWARGSRLVARRLSPSPRLTVVDGESVWTAEGEGGKPLRFAVVDQSPTQADNLRAVPASPEESLFRLDPGSARDVDPAAEPFARQVSFGVSGTNSAERVVVSFDGDGCVARLDGFPAGEGVGDARWTTTFSAPLEPYPGVRLYRRSETVASAGGREVSVVSSFDRIKVNVPPEPGTFDRSRHFGK